MIVNGKRADAPFTDFMPRHVSGRSQRSSVFAIRINLHFWEELPFLFRFYGPRSSAIQASDFGSFGIRFFAYLLRTRWHATVADPDISFGGGARGAEVERRRREDWGPEDAEVGGVWGGGVLLAVIVGVYA